MFPVVTNYVSTHLYDLHDVVCTGRMVSTAVGTSKVFEADVVDADEARHVRRACLAF